MKWCTVNARGEITSMGLCSDQVESVVIEGISDQVIAPVYGNISPETHYFKSGGFYEKGTPPSAWHVWDWVSLEWVFNLESARQAAAERIDAECQQQIMAGFSSSALGAAFHYPSKLTDQQNLLASVTASMYAGLPAEWTTPFWCADAAGTWKFRNHTAVQIQQVGVDAKAAILSAMAKNDQLQTLIVSATTLNQLETLSWESI